MTSDTALVTGFTTSSERPGLAELVATIRPLARQRALPQTIAQQVAEALARRQSRRHPAHRGRTRRVRRDYVRHTLHTEATFSVQAVVWRPGQVTEIHDHLVWCSFMVLQGAETETLYAIDGDRLVELGQQHRPTGSVSGAAPPDDIHRVTNTGDDVAITLHVYGADLTDRTSVRRIYRQRPHN